MTVLWLDPATREVVRIPASELSPGLVQVQMKGSEEPVWADPALFQPSPFQHPPFPEEIRNLLRTIKATLDEVHPMSLEAWEEGFRRDQNPEQEIALWLHLADTYAYLAAKDPQLPLAARQEYFRFLVACANGPREQIWQTTSPGTMDRALAAQLVERFYGPQSPP